MAESITNKIIKNFLSKEELKLIDSYLSLRHKFNENIELFPQTNDASLNLTGLGWTGVSGYGDPLCDSLLLCKKELMEKETGLSLLPTYAYWRMYTYGSYLKKHKDRPSCEISVTLHLGGDKKWPIFVEGKSFLLKPGDAIIYRGCEQEHWREKFYGDWYSQLFIHYVNANGPNKEWYRDKRKEWGTPPGFK